MASATITSINVCSADGSVLRPHTTLVYAWKHLQTLGVNVEFDDLEDYLDSGRLLDGTFQLTKTVRERVRVNGRRPRPAETKKPHATARSFELTCAATGHKIQVASIGQLNVFLNRKNCRNSLNGISIGQSVPVKGWLIVETTKRVSGTTGSV